MPPDPEQRTPPAGPDPTPAEGRRSGVLEQASFGLMLAYYLGSIALSGLLGLYLLWGAIEGPSSLPFERVFLAIFAAIAFFFGWGLPVLAKKHPEPRWLKKYTAGYVLLLAGLYVLLRWLVFPLL